ncbi:methyltransferase [Dethiosulfatarculus sandiegensis]|uniref:O-methyltransferase n=1 Tax=Dethiosulfatarculus sandiegensis TaxID=1429043 RepID=A0A0D2HJM2_9BACT|nr:methyltransferase [Dethiosulfatarculus sandiegensis]KIX10853.1 O-methyltransferase [Dethiosulfatarculus sandiegensis]
MIKLPQPKTNSRDLFTPMLQAIIHRLILGAVNLNIFDELDEPVTADEVARKKGFHGGNTEALLNCLCAAKMVTKKNRRFQNSPLAAEYLRCGKETYLGGFLQRSHQVMLQYLDDMEELVKNGPASQPNRKNFSEGEFWADYAEDMAAYAASGQARLIAEQVAGLPEFPKMKKMLDLGAGPGMMALAITQAHPDMKAVVLDQPEVVEVSAKIIEKYEMQDRVQTLGRDYCQEDIGEGYDLVLASCTLNFFRDRMHRILGKIYDSINPGGVFVSFHDGIRAEGTEPNELIISMSSMLFSGETYNFREDELASAMLEAGFRSVRSRNFDTPMGELELVVARK